MTDAFKFIQQILLVDDHMKRLAADMEKVESKLSDHDLRITRLEFAVTMNFSPRRIVLPGES